jgi:hypothetical protein
MKAMNAAAAGGCRRASRQMSTTVRRSFGVSGRHTRSGPLVAATVSGTIATPSPRAITARIMARSFVSNASRTETEAAASASSTVARTAAFSRKVTNERP